MDAITYEAQVERLTAALELVRSMRRSDLTNFDKEIKRLTDLLIANDICPGCGLALLSCACG